MYESSTSGPRNLEGRTSTLTPNTDVQDSRVRDYKIPYAKSGTSIKSDKVHSNQRGRDEGHLASDSAKTRFALRRWSERAKESATRLLASANEQDFMEATNAGIELTDSLSALWKLRECRESTFSEIVNLTQLALAQAAFEKFTPDQCTTLVQLLDDCLLSGATDETEVRLARNLLQKAGLSPWRGFSQRED